MNTKKQPKRNLWIRRMFILTVMLLVAVGISLLGAYLFVEFFEPAPVSARMQNPSSISKDTVVQVDLKEYDTVLKTEQEIHQGALVLVNNENHCQFLEDGELVSVKEKQQVAYKVSNAEVQVNQIVMESLDTMLSDFQQATGFRDLLVASGYRNKELQETLFEREAQRKGAQEASLWVAQPGGSEHHSGYGIDFSIYTDLGITLDYTGNGKCQWLNQNCQNYGFVVRFPTEKREITGIDYEPWHFRYVGNPHASLMVQHYFCLEEYVEYLKQFTFPNQVLAVTDSNGKNYEIYYIPIKGERCEVPVPREREYSISGNNQDGFIITVSADR